MFVMYEYRVALRFVMNNVVNVCVERVEERENKACLTKH